MPTVLSSSNKLNKKSTFSILDKEKDSPSPPKIQPNFKTDESRLNQLKTSM